MTEPRYLPLAQPGRTPLRVMTIAGSDSGGGAGIQADMRTFALLGVHSLVAVTAVTVQNSLGVKGFHEIPTDMIAGQIEAVATDIGVQAAKTGMLASSAIIETVAGTWRDLGLAGVTPFVVDPVCASMHGDPLLHHSALDTLRTELFPLASLVTPNLDEVRLIVGIDVIDGQHQRIVEYINMLHEARLRGDRGAIERVIEEMVDYTLSHFSFEESMMEQAHYRFLQPHRRVHELFVRRVNEFQQRFKLGEDYLQVATDMQNALVTWLMNHIKREDMDYAATVRANLGAAELKGSGGLGGMLRRLFGGK